MGDLPFSASIEAIRASIQEREAGSARPSGQRDPVFSGFTANPKSDGIKAANETGSDPIYSVSQITQIIKNLLDRELPPLCIEGEISNYKASSMGHYYFTLKDDKSIIQAVLFKGKAQYLNFVPKDGMTVRVKGRISVYAARGYHQITVDTMELAGQGDILRMLEERKQRLAMEGLFDQEDKQPLPFFPETVGVVTSPTGAALRDILQITKRRNHKVNVVILPCAVQGNDAAPMIASQIRRANYYKMCDVLIVGRGGGSLEDLLPFSEECVVRAVAESEIPVVSAVGHEIDWALSDFAADMRAPTPSAAAELCTPLLDEIVSGLDRVKNDLIQEMQKKIENKRLLIRNFSKENLELHFRSIEQPYIARFEDAKEILVDNIKERLKELSLRVEKAKITLEAASPHAILDRGYAMVRNKDTGRIIRNATDVSKGSLIEIVPKEGIITARVEETDFLQEENE